MESNFGHGIQDRAHRGLLVASVTGLLVVVLVFWRAPSLWLQALTPDGRLDAGATAFVNSLRPLLVLLVAALFALALLPGARVAIASAWLAGAPAATAPTRLAWGLGAFALVLRLLIARFADIGLGDDGARVAWLEQWLQHPGLVWSGLWTPGHLYLHAAMNVLIRNPVWSGVALSALASGITVGVLTRSVERDWGRFAALCGGVTMSLLPVSLAHGSTPDINPVFALFPVVALASAQQYVHRGSPRWLWLGCLLAGWATWCRYEAIALVPAIALVLWPRWKAMCLFVVGAFLPVVVWAWMESRASGQLGHVAHVMQNDPGLQGNNASHLFSLMGAVWQAVPLPVLLLGGAGAFRSLRARRGRAWMLPAAVHLAALTGAALLLGAGTQARYHILAGTVAAAYAGVGLAGVWRAHRGPAVGVAAVALVLFVIAPGLYPNDNDLWIRRSARLRAVVDEVRARAAGRDVAWVSEEAGYFYVCRARPPIARYHAMPRADSDPAALLRDLAGEAIVAVQPADRARARWQDLVARASATYEIRPAGTVEGYEIYDMLRRAAPGGDR